MLVQDIDFCITAFKRPHKLRNLIDSIKRRNVPNRILVAEQGHEDVGFKEDYPAEIIQLPYDYGLSASRNALANFTDAEFILLLEDDFRFTEHTCVDKMLSLMELADNIGVVGGAVIENGRRVQDEFYPIIKGTKLIQEPDGNKWKTHQGIIYKETGCVKNFALFRTEVFKDVQWDEELKLHERIDFFIRLMGTKWRVLYTPMAQIEHDNTEHDVDYESLRSRDEFMMKMLEKHNIDLIKYLNGKVI